MTGVIRQRIHFHKTVSLRERLPFAQASICTRNPPAAEANNVCEAISPNPYTIGKAPTVIVRSIPAAQKTKNKTCLVVTIARGRCCRLSLASPRRMDEHFANQPLCRRGLLGGPETRCRRHLFADGGCGSLGAELHVYDVGGASCGNADVAHPRGPHLRACALSRDLVVSRRGERQ
jgi:hypothetical protein